MSDTNLQTIVQKPKGGKELLHSLGMEGTWEQDWMAPS